MTTEQISLTKGGMCKEITDQKIIAKLDIETPYVSLMESIETYDNNTMNDQAYLKSSEVVGEHRPIEIAVWSDDPNKNSIDNPFRIHMRVINGRHRLLQNPNWHRKYYDLSIANDKVLAYFQLRQHFDLQKKSSPKEREVLIEQMAMYMNKEQGLPPHECCSEIVKLLVPQGIASESTITTACPQKYKNAEKSLAKKGNIRKGRQGYSRCQKSQGQDFCKEYQIGSRNYRLNTELDASMKESAGIHSELTKIQSEFDEVQSKLRIISQLEETVEIDNVKIHIKVDATNNKLIVEKA